MFGRLTRGSVMAATLVAGAAVTFTPLATAANAALVSEIPSNYFTVVDSGGVNDENGGGQLELTQMGRDDSAGGFYQLFWSWDGTDFQSQTGDACALFDSDGDGNINFDICAQIENGGSGTIVQTDVSPTAHTCGDAKDDRCTTPGDVSPGAGQLVAGPIEDLSDTGGNLVTATDPFAGQVGAAASPNDSTIAVKIAKSLLPDDAQLVNVCDYESIANGGNNNPNDCIVNPGGGFLSIVKHTNGGDGTFDFDVDNPDNSPSSFGRSVTTVGGSGTADAAAVIIGTATSVTEDVPDGWLLDGASCTLEGGGSTGSFDGATVSDVEIESGSITTCTFTNTLAAPVLTLDKSADVSTYDAVGDVVSYTYTLTNDGNVPLDAPYTVDDDVIDGSGSSVVCPDSPDPLPAGESVDCTASYTIAQADLDAGSVHNTAQGHASYAGEAVDSNTDEVTVTAVKTPGLQVVKAVDVESAEYGDTLTYTLTVRNTGNVTLHEVVVTDEVPEETTYVADSAAPADIASYDADADTVAWAVGDLAPGAEQGDLTFQVSIDVPDFDPEDGVQATVIDNVAVGASDEVGPTPSNEVHTPVTAVLGVKVERPQKPELPFTGAVLSTRSGIALGLLAIAAGLLLSVTARRRRV
ncbi:MAG TPA: hypothetical protein VFJ98_06065 [Mycobacteriales bacterium]|nr:hypothetical protein [Mycobacteriales bacterium]